MPKRVLLVDDDYVVHRYVTKLCRPFLLRHAWNPAEARKIIRKRVKKNQEKPFDLVICDVHMPPHVERPQGFLLARELRKRFPKMPILMHSDDLPVLKYLKSQGFPFVDKLEEKTIEKLRKAIRAELRQ